MLISMPLLTTIAATMLLVALRLKAAWAWFIAGSALGLGVYTYNGYVVLVAAVVVFLGITVGISSSGRRRLASGISILAAGFLIVAFPLLWLAVSEPDFFFQHHRMVSFLQEPGFQAAQTASERAAYFLGRARVAAGLLVDHPEIDYVDGMGGRGAMQPVLGWLTYGGLVISVFRWRKPAHLLMALIVILGLSTVMFGTVDLGEFRRPFVILPFAYGLAGVALVDGARGVAGLVGRAHGRFVAGAGVAIVLIATSSLSTWTYFGRIVHDDHIDWVYAADLVDALDAAHSIDEPGIVYFYSGRWSYEYETRRFLYPDTPGIDRSREFGEFSLERLDEGPVTYVLLSPYLEEFDRLRELYPGGIAVEAGDEHGARRFSIYHLASVRSGAFG